MWGTILSMCSTVHPYLTANSTQKHHSNNGKRTVTPYTTPTLTISTKADPELDMDWIHPWIGLDWIESGFWGNFVDWIGSEDCNPVFFHLYIFYINNWQTLSLYNTIMCILADFNRLTWLRVLQDYTLELYCFMTSSHLAPASGPHAVSIRRPLSVCRLNAQIAD